MKIALFTDTYDEINGVGNTFRTYARWCVKNKKQIDIFTHGSEDYIEEHGDVRILRFKPAIPIEFYPGLNFDMKIYRERIRKEVKHNGYDIIHIAQNGSMSLNGLAFAKRYDIPMIGSYHTAIPEYATPFIEKLIQSLNLPIEIKPHDIGKNLENTAWEFTKWFYNQIPLVLVPTMAVKEQLSKILSCELGIFSRGIETDRFTPRYRQEHEGITVLYVGRVSVEKNLKVLVDIFKDKKDATLSVVGDGPYLEEMKRELPNAKFLGFLKGEELSRAYASADIFVFPSLTDTFGNVVLEAMASGVPAIVSDQMGPKEIVDDGKNGFIFLSRDDLEQKINLLIANPAKRREMGRNARQYAMSCTWDSVFGRLFSDYQKVIEEYKTYKKLKKFYG